MPCERRDLDSSGISTVQNCRRVEEEIEVKALQPWREWAIKSAAGSSMPPGSAGSAVHGTPASSSSAVNLVDIGANTQTLSDGRFWGQVARAGSSGVAAIILTGTSASKVAAAAQRVQQSLRLRGLLRAGGGEGAVAADVSEPRSKEMRTLIKQLRCMPALELPQLLYTAGFHPHEAKHATDADFATFQHLLETDAACVAVGECGLDYDRMFSPREIQISVFRRHLQLAIKCNKSLFLHERERDASKGTPLGSFRDLLLCLDEAAAAPPTSSCPSSSTSSSRPLHPSRVCVHCWTGGEAEMVELVRRGYMIGLTGFICMRKRGAHLRQAIARGLLPLDQIMVETDAPYMRGDADYYLPSPTRIPSPPPASRCLASPADSSSVTPSQSEGGESGDVGRGGGRGRKTAKTKARHNSEPADVVAVVQCLSELTAVPPEVIAARTSANAARFFGISLRQ